MFVYWSVLLSLDSWYIVFVNPVCLTSLTKPLTIYALCILWCTDTCLLKWTCTVILKGCTKKKKFYFFYKLREVMTRPHFLSSIEGVSLYCPSKANSGVHMGIQLTLPCLPLCPEAREDIWYNSLRTGYVWVSWQGEGDKSIVNQIWPWSTWTPASP